MASVLDRPRQDEQFPDDDGSPPMWARRDLKSRLITYLRRALSIFLVIVATGAGAYLALVTYHQSTTLSVGEIRMSVSPGHRGALDVYVPLVDWGARFEAIRAPVRIRVDLQTVNRGVATGLAQGQSLDIDKVKAEAEQALTTYIMRLLALTVLAGAALGLLVAFAIRSRVPRLRWTAPTSVIVALGIGVALALLIPPRGEISNPQYYAHGPDIPRALEAVEAAQRTPGALNQELDAQLVGLAQLVVAPGNREPLAGRPSAVIASDLHNNTIVLPVLAKAAGDRPVFFPGDLTDRGSPLENRLVRQVAKIGKPFVFVSGNHDSDTLQRQLVDDGAIVLSELGQLRRDGSHGPTVVKVGGLRVAGYSDPYERRRADGYADRYDEKGPSEGDRQAFADWLKALVGEVDVVLVHEPALLTQALADLRKTPPSDPLVFVTGHTHEPSLERPAKNVAIVNGGSIGAGGTGNLRERTDTGLARLIYDREPSFTPLATDLIEIDTGTGSATARRERLDDPSGGTLDLPFGVSKGA
jgi:predicted phosphodiesterase